MGLRRWIEVTFQKEGIHCYPAAATEPGLADVAYLANPHRHIFHFYVSIEVYHDDREIEFIQFKHWLQSLFTEGVMSIDYMSCEMLADGLINKVTTQYPGRNVAVRCYEDDENGAVLEYWPE